MMRFVMLRVIRLVMSRVIDWVMLPVTDLAMPRVTHCVIPHVIHSVMLRVIRLVVFYQKHRNRHNSPPRPFQKLRIVRFTAQFCAVSDKEAPRA